MRPQQSWWLALVLACGETPDWSGDRVDIFVPEGLQLCGGTGPYLDAFVAFLATQLALDDPGRIRYRWHKGVASIADECGGPTTGSGPGSDGCGASGEAHSRSAVDLHALAHAVLAELGPPQTPLEGLAGLHDLRGTDSFFWATWQAKGLFQRAHVLSESSDPFLAVDLATSPALRNKASVVTAALLQHSGPRRFVEFLRDLPRRPKQEDVDRSFARIYQRSWRDEVPLMSAFPALYCQQRTSPLEPYTCRAPELSPIGQEWQYVRMLRCDDDDVVGGVATGEEQAFVGRTIEIPAPGQYRLTVGGDPGALVTFGACDACWLVARDTVVSTSFPQELTLTAGRHFLQLAGPADTPTWIGIVLERIDP